MASLIEACLVLTEFHFDLVSDMFNGFKPTKHVLKGDQLTNTKEIKGEYTGSSAKVP